MKKLLPPLIVTLLLAGCSAPPDLLSPSLTPEQSGDAEAPQSEIFGEQVQEIHSRLLTGNLFEIAPTEQSEAQLYTFHAYFYDTVPEINACSYSLTLVEQLGDLPLIASRQFGYGESYSQFSQFVFDAGTSVAASELTQDFADNYLVSPCKSTMIFDDFEDVSLTPNLPLGFTGHAWIHGLNLEEDEGGGNLNIALTVSTNGRFIMAVTSSASSGEGLLFTPLQANSMSGLAVKTFTSIPLPSR